MAKSSQPKPNRATGPRSAEGKARSSMNALKSGIYSQSLVIPGEDPDDLDALAEEYFQRFQPALPEQRDQVDILVRSTWTLRRLAAAEAQVWIYEMEDASHLSDTAPMGQIFKWCDRVLSRLQRIVNTTQRNYRDALHELERLQSQAPVPPGPVLVPDPAPVRPPAEFVSSTSAAPPANPPKPLQKAAAPPEKKPPFHKPGAECFFDPLDRSPYRRCPLCFPDDYQPE